jgi:predicted RNA-binding Zn-ribbon protein involved in translation (DUF1610 family)
MGLSVDQTGICKSCDGEIQSSLESGRLSCPTCSQELWFCQFDGELTNTTSERIEDAFGLRISDFASSEIIEILRSWREERDQDVWHHWNLSDSNDTDSPSIDCTNPYQSPHTTPRRYDWKSETMVFRAIVGTDQANIEWATSTYGTKSSVAAIIAMAALVCFVALGVLFENQFEQLFELAKSSWTAIFVLVSFGIFLARKVPRLVMSPYINVLRRRCEQDRLYAESHFTLVVRPTTLSVHTDFSSATWPLREVWCPHHDAHLIVLRVAPHRLLYIPSNSWTIPEPFDLFNKGVRRRVRRFWQHSVLRFELN